MHQIYSILQFSKEIKLERMRLHGYKSVDKQKNIFNDRSVEATISRIDVFFFQCWQQCTLTLTVGPHRLCCC